MVIKARFKIYDYVVCDNQKTLYQLEHFKNKRIRPFKKITYNANKKAYRIYGQWVTKKRLYKLMIPVDEVLLTEVQTPLDRVLDELRINLAY